MKPLDEKIDHVRGPSAGHLVLEYGDYECPYSRQAFRAIERVETELGEGVRFAFRHFPLTGIHPHALAAAAAAEAAARQDRFWDMHGLLFHRQKALEDGDLRRYAADLGLDVALFDADRVSAGILDRVRRDVESSISSGEVRDPHAVAVSATPTPVPSTPIPRRRLASCQDTKLSAGSTPSAMASLAGQPVTGPALDSSVATAACASSAVAAISPPAPTSPPPASP
jgi:hypothetical protein